MSHRIPSPLRHRPPGPGVHPMAGAALVEALVALLVVAFGVLGFIALQARTAVSGVEGYQRALALELVGDMGQRMAINRAGTRKSYYLRADIGVDASCQVPPAPAAGAAAANFDTAAFDLANADICAWHGLIREAVGAPGAGAGTVISRVRGCITATGNPDEFLVALVWQGVQPTGPSPLACGRGDTAAFPNDNLRRGVSTVVRIGSLS